MLEKFFHGAPTIYDIASFVIIVLLLIVVISMHIRQMAHARSINHLLEKEQLNSWLKKSSH